MKKRELTKRKRKSQVMREDILNLLGDASRSWKGQSGKLNKIKSIMTTNIIGKREKKPKGLKDNFCPSGD